MTRLGKLVFLLMALVCLSSPVFSQNPPTDVHVHLTLADNKTTYRIGETIKLVLEFTADREGYQADTIPDRNEPTSDSISISPDAGVYRWLEEINGNRLGGRDVISYAPLSTNPTRVELLVNDSLRIDHPGTYSIKVTTKRVSNRSSRHEFSPAIVMTTNEVSFDVQPMSNEDEAKEVKRLSDQLDATHDVQAEEEITRQLSFLTGDESSREKMRRFLNSEGRSGNYGAHIYYGIFIARNRGLVLQLLETAMRDSNTPVTSSLLGMMTSLRFRQQNAGVPAKPPVAGWLGPDADPRVIEIQDAYVAELAAGLGKRTGKSQTTTAMTILAHLPKDPQAAGALLNEARRIVIQQFDNLTPFDHEYLLEQYWDKLRDPSLIPSLKQILSRTDRLSKGNHRPALKRLIELAPDEARPYVVAEISDPQSFVDWTIMGSLPDETIPEVDSILLNQLRAVVKVGGVLTDIFIKQKAALAVRFATNGIYPDLMLLYRENAARLTISSRADLLAYLVKQNEREALPLIEEELNSVPPEQEFNFLPELTRLYFSDGIDALLRKRLESDTPQIASTTAYLVSLHGPESDQKVLEARLERWRKEWANRIVEAETNLQGTVERELVYGLIHAKSWKLSPERVKELQQSCITKYCRENFPGR